MPPKKPKGKRNQAERQGNIGAGGSQTIATTSATTSSVTAVVSEQQGEQEVEQVTVTLPVNDAQVVPETEASTSTTTSSATVIVSQQQAEQVERQDTIQVVTDTALDTANAEELPQHVVAEDTNVVADVSAQMTVAPSTSSLDSQLSDGAIVTSSTSSTPTTSILVQLASTSAAEIQPEPVIAPSARFIDPEIDFIEEIISIKNTAQLDQETLKNVRETASRGFTIVIMVEKLQRDFPQLFFFSDKYKARLSQELKQYQLRIEKIQRLCIVFVLKENIAKFSLDDRELAINIVQADTVEKLGTLLGEHKSKLGNFSLGAPSNEGKRYDERILQEKLRKKIRQEVVFHLVSNLFNNMELMQQENHMALLYAIVTEESAMDSYVYFKRCAPRLGLGDIGNLNILDEVFDNINEQKAFQKKLESCYNTLLERRKKLFTSMAKPLLDLKFMQAENIYKLVALFHPDRTAKYSYEMLKQQAHEFNMPDFLRVFNNAVDEKEFAYIQELLKASYFYLEKERKKQIRSLCENCSNTEIVSVNSLPKARLIELVKRDTSPEQCHTLFKEYAAHFQIEGFSEIFSNTIYKESSFLQNELRYQRMRLSINEKFAILSCPLREDDVLQLKIFVNQMKRSESVGAYLGITEFDLSPEWEEEAIFLAYHALAEAAMRFRKVNPDVEEEIKTVLTIKERSIGGEENGSEERMQEIVVAQKRCQAVYDLVYRQSITVFDKGLKPQSVIGLAAGELQVKTLVALKSPKPALLHDSRYALHQQQQASASTSTVSAAPQ